MYFQYSNSLCSFSILKHSIFNLFFQNSDTKQDNLDKEDSWEELVLSQDENFWSPPKKFESPNINNALTLEDLEKEKLRLDSKIESLKSKRSSILSIKNTLQ